MTLRHLLPLTLLISALFAGCVNHVATYPGPRRAASQVAHIPWHESQDQIRVTAVDGQRLTATRATLELLPGWRTLEVVYTPHNTLQSYPVRVTFRADAGMNTRSAPKPSWVRWRVVRGRGNTVSPSIT
jgi:hypothetical protein